MALLAVALVISTIFTFFGGEDATGPVISSRIGITLLFLGLVIWRLIVWRRKRAGTTKQPDDGSGPDGGSTTSEGPDGEGVEPEPSVATTS